MLQTFFPGTWQEQKFQPKGQFPPPPGVGRAVSSSLWKRGTLCGLLGGRVWSPAFLPWWRGLIWDAPCCRGTGSLVGHRNVTEGRTSKCKRPEKSRHHQESKVASGRGKGRRGKEAWLPLELLLMRAFCQHFRSEAQSCCSDTPCPTPSPPGTAEPGAHTPAAAIQRWLVRAEVSCGCKIHPELGSLHEKRMYNISLITFILIPRWHDPIWIYRVK